MTHTSDRIPPPGTSSTVIQTTHASQPTSSRASSRSLRRPPPITVTSRARRLSRADHSPRRGEDRRSVYSQVFGPAGTVTLRGLLCHDCGPTSTSVQTTSELLADRVLGWYRSNPAVSPALHSSANG